MKLWIDVCDTNWVKAGMGPIQVQSVTIDRLLDGAGGFALDCVATDERTLSELTLERRIKVYVSDESGTRLIAKGVVRRREQGYTNGGFTLSVSGPDALDDLKRYSVLLNRQFTQLPRNEVLSALAGLAGWTVTADTTDQLLSARFDGVSVLSALQKICDQNGIHLREALTENSTLEIGAFGTDCGVVAVSADSIPTGVYANDDIAIIASIQKTEDSEALANWLIPIGAGEGEASLTLKHSTRYGVKSMLGADGRPLYYLTDEDSIATYGVIQRAGTFKDIAPLTNSPVSKQIAGDALFDAAQVWLKRNSVKQVVYSLSLKKVKKVIRPGDKIRVKYRGDVETSEGKILQLENVDGLFWVTQVSESYTPDGMCVSLSVSNVDQIAQDSAKTIIGALEGMRVQNLKPATFPTTWSWNGFDFLHRFHFSDIMDASNKNAEFTLKIDNSVTEVIRVTLQFKTKPLFSLMRIFDGSFRTDLGTQQNRALGHEFGVLIGNNYPRGLRLYINGVDMTAHYGGPWNPAPTNAPVDVTLDITDPILLGGLYRTHDIVFRADYTYSATGLYFAITDPSSHGIVEVNMTVLAVSQAILPT